MRCPNCQHDTVVLDSRQAPHGAYRRRRRCSTCGRLFTTYERIVNEDRIKIASTAAATRDEMMHLLTLFRQLDELLKGLEV